VDTRNGKRHSYGGYDMSLLLKHFEELKQDITIKANLGSRENTGFHAVYCPICNKTERKTGGFKFDDDKIVYHCFRGSCDASTVYEFGKPISKKFRALMESIGVTIPAQLLMVKSSFQKTLESLDERLYKKHYYKDVQKLESFTKHEQASKMNREYWESYFSKRCCDMNDVLLCDTGKYKGCSAIEMKFFDKTIGYQIITRHGDYIKQFDGNTNLLYIPNGTIQNTVILVEGTMDAKCFPNAIATLQSKISPEQAYMLKGKNVIMLPDMDGSNRFIEQFMDYGWSISIPDWGVKDLNEAVIKYGVIVTAELIMEGICKNKTKAEMLYKMRKI
jgi:hypothetical protein